jgi:integrase
LATKQGFLERNPFDDLEPKDWPKKGEERTRHLVGDEWERLLIHVPEEMRAAVMILVNTGCRRGELMNLKHSDVNLDSRIVYLGKTKTGKNRWMPLTPDVVQLIKGLPRRVGDHRVFPFFTPNALSVAVKRAIRKAKIPDFRLHDLRQNAESQKMPSGSF